MCVCMHVCVCVCVCADLSVGCIGAVSSASTCRRCTRTTRILYACVIRINQVHTHVHTTETWTQCCCNAHNGECFGVAHNRCACTRQLAQGSIWEEPSTQCGGNEGNQLSGEQLDRNRNTTTQYLKILHHCFGSLIIYISIIHYKTKTCTH